MIIVVLLNILLFRFEINDKKKLITSVSLRHRLQILTENGEQKPAVSTDHPLLAHCLLETEVHNRRGCYFIWSTYINYTIIINISIIHLL